MNEEKKKEIALMRYSVIAPLITGASNEELTKRAYFIDAAKKGVIGSNGKVRTFSASTIEKWYRSYQKSGFDGLVPTGRVDVGKSRKLDDELQEQIIYYKTNYPRMSASAIYRQLREKGDIRRGEVSESTVNRYINRYMITQKNTNTQDMRRYERPHINEVWCGDTCVGPYLKDSEGRKHKVFIIALIDDASRFIVGINAFYNDRFVNLMSVMKSAVAKYGKPQMFNFDNGSSFKNKQMELLAARIGSVVHYDQPYTPTQKAKIERWFRTLRDQWMCSLDMRNLGSLEEFRASLLAYVHKYNQTIHSSLKGKSPYDRFFSEPDYIKRLNADNLENSFLLEVERRVSADSVIVIDQIQYEVDCRFAKQKIKLRYSPDFKDIFVVEPDETLTRIRILNKVENSFVKREKVYLSQGE